MKSTRSSYRNQLFESPSYLEPVFEAWRRELFDAHEEAETPERGTRAGVWRRKWKSSSIGQCLGVIGRSLTFERKNTEMRREIWNQGLMYAIVSLIVFLVVPLFRYAV